MQLDKIHAQRILINKLQHLADAVASPEQQGTLKVLPAHEDNLMIATRHGAPLFVGNPTAVRVLLREAAFDSVVRDRVALCKLFRHLEPLGLSDDAIWGIVDSIEAHGEPYAPGGGISSQPI